MSYTHINEKLQKSCMNVFAYFLPKNEFTFYSHVYIHIYIYIYT